MRRTNNTLRNAGRPYRLAAGLSLLLLAHTLHAQVESRTPVRVPRSGDATATPMALAIGISKTALNPATGAPLTGPIGPGTPIKYVIEAAPPGSGIVYPSLTIAESMGAGLTYVAGSLQLPPGWTSTPNPPFSPTPTAVFSGSAYSAASGFTYPVSAATAQLGTGGGDGYTPVIVGSKVFGFHHHNSNGTVSCWNTGNMSTCPAAPNSTVQTMVDSRFVIRANAIYYPAFAAGSGGIACYNATGAPCTVAFTPVAPFTMTTTPIPGLGPMAGVVALPSSPNDVFIAINDRMYCRSVPSMGNCSAAVSPAFATGVSIPASGGLLNQSSDILADESNGRIYWQSEGTLLRCVVVGTGASCWTPGAVLHSTAAGYGYLLSPLLASTGATGGVCVHSSRGGFPSQSSNNAPLCWLANGAGPSSPPAIVAAVPYVAGVANYTVMPYRLPAVGSTNTLRTRVFFPGRTGNASTLAPGVNTGGRTFCFDYASLSACAGFTLWAATATPGLSPGSGRTMSEYGYMTDPSDPLCTYGLGDAQTLFRFNTLTGAEGCQSKLWPLPNPAAAFCDGKKHPISWGNVAIIFRPSALIGGTIVVKNGSTVLMTIPVTAANVYSISSIPYGSNPNLTVEFNPAYSGTPATIPDYYIHISYSSNANPQICYEATTSCPAGSYTNSVVFGSGPSSNPATAPQNFSLTALSELASTCETQPPSVASTCCPPMQGGAGMANMFTQTAHPSGTGYSMVFTPSNPATINFVNGYVAYLALLKFLCPTVDHLQVTFTPRTAAAIGGAWTGPSPAAGYTAFTVNIGSSGLIGSPSPLSQFGPTAFPPSPTVYGVQASSIGVDAAGQPVICGFDSEVCRLTTRFTWIYNVGARTVAGGMAPLTIEK